METMADFLLGGSKITMDSACSHEIKRRKVVTNLDKAVKSRKITLSTKVHIDKAMSFPGLPWWLRQSRIHLQCGRPEFDPWVGKIPWRKAWQPTPVVLPGKPPWTEESGGLLFMGSQGVRHD